MTKNEAERLAAMGNALRPDWPVSSLLTFLAKHQAKAYRDVAVALAWVAADPVSQTPARLAQDGPWWKATQAGEPTFVTRTTMCPEHPTEREWACRPCLVAAADAETTQTKLLELRKASAS